MTRAEVEVPTSQGDFLHPPRQLWLLLRQPKDFEYFKMVYPSEGSQLFDQNFSKNLIRAVSAAGFERGSVFFELHKF